MIIGEVRLYSGNLVRSAEAEAGPNERVKVVALLECRGQGGQYDVLLTLAGHRLESDVNVYVALPGWQKSHKIQEACGPWARLRPTFSVGSKLRLECDIRYSHASGAARPIRVMVVPADPAHKARVFDLPLAGTPEPPAGLIPARAEAEVEVVEGQREQPVREVITEVPDAEP